MDKFKALLEAVTLNGGDLPETFLTDASSAYDEDMAVYGGKIDAQDLRIAELEAENTRLKEHNYDLLMAAQAPAEEPDDEPDQPADDTETITPDDLFDE